MNRFVTIAVAVVLATNAVVLAGVAYNRSGEPVSTIELTERELRWQRYYGDVAQDENTGVALSLDWQVPASEDGAQRRYYISTQPSWLDEAKLAELGFDLDDIRQKSQDNKYSREKHKKEVVLVLEYNGPAYRADVERAKLREASRQAEVAANPDDEELAEKLEIYSKDLARLTTSDSRLFVVDAGIDLEALKQRHAGNSNILLVKGVIRAYWGDPGVAGYIDHQTDHRVHVPLPQANQLSRLEKRDYYAYGDDQRDLTPRYRVKINVGQRLEPWVESVSLITDDHD